MTFKPLRQRKREELVDLAIDAEIFITDETKDQIIDKLSEVGINNKSLRAMEEKKEKESKAKKAVVEATEDKTEAPPEFELPEGKTAVYMSRNNRSFLFRGARFSQENRIQLLDDDVAEDLLARHTGFQKLSRKEVLSYYK